MATILPSPGATWPRWATTLKFRIVVIAAVTGVVAAVATAQLVLARTQASVEHLLLDNAADDRAKMAALLSSKLQMLQDALMSEARRTQPSMLADTARTEDHLLGRHALGVLFDSLFAAAPDGQIVARVERGVATHELPNIADRAYFRQAMTSDQPVVSDPVLSRINQTPRIIIAAPLLAPDGRVAGALAGSIALYSSALFSDLGSGNAAAGARDLVMDRAGRILAHTDQSRVLGKAADEPGLAALFNEWHASGSPIATEGRSHRIAPHLVSLAGIPFSDWTLVRLTPLSAALAPVDDARRTAWQAAALVGLVSALIAGGLAWRMTRPISRLRSHAEQLLDRDADDPVDSAWTHGSGEVGDLSRAFHLVIAQRGHRQNEARALARQLEAVLDHAEVGIALTRSAQFELVSRQFCTIFRSRKEDLMGQAARTIYASDEAYAALSAQARPAFAEHGGFDTELQLQRRTGEMFWARLRGRAVVAGDPSQGTIWTIEDVTAARAQRELLTFSASHDALTGLLNRAAFEAQLEAATQASAQAPFCTLFIDLDHFKQVNDSGGHAAGDAVLRDVARTLEAQLRRADTVARIGGDEFAVLLPHCPPDQAQLLANKLRAAIEAYELRWESQRFHIGASVGLVSVHGYHHTAAEVLRTADEACYAAKRLGRNRVETHPLVAAGPHPAADDEQQACAFSAV